MFNDKQQLTIQIPEGLDLNGQTLCLEDFYSYAPENRFIFIPTRELWPAKSVNDRIDPVVTDKLDGNGKLIKLPATTWLSKNRSVEQLTWAPGMPSLIEDQTVAAGGFNYAPGLNVFNLYLPPSIEPGRSDKATPWIEHINKVYPNHTDHIVNWLAQRVQKPGEKINHALVLGGAQGIGKDTLLEPVSHAIGPWNLADVSPTQLTGRFNGFVKSVILRVSEARDLGDVDRYSFYEHLKTYTAAPPYVLRVDEKNIREYSVMNVCGVVITTNHKSGGMYLPADDRRHYVAWSEITRDDFTEAYWKYLWNWLEMEGFYHVTAFLQEHDISGFNPKDPPPKTDAFWEIVDSNRAPEDAEMADCIDELGRPDAITINMLSQKADPKFQDWLQDRRNSRQIPFRMEEAGYMRIRNKDTKDGLWVVSGKRSAIYAKITLSKREQFQVAMRLTTEGYS